MSDSKFMQEFRHGMEHCRANLLRECAVRPPEPTWEEKNGVVKFTQPVKSQPLRLVLLVLAENSYVVMLCDKDWTPAGQAPCDSVQEFSNKRAANLAFEAAARLCSQAGRIVIEQFCVQIQVSRPDEFVTVKFGDGY